MLNLYPNGKLMNRLSGSICVASLSVLSAVASTDRPNVVFILADDLGWTDLGCYGSTFYETPYLDRLALEGMRFTDAYASCNVCSPTRGSIMTGKYPATIGITSHIGLPQPDHWKKNTPLLPSAYKEYLEPDEITLAEAMKPAGYRTAFIGKWHLGDDPKYFPDQQGFDVNIGGCGLGHPPSYFSPYRIPTLTDGPKGEYLTDRLTDEALKFMDENKDQPFLIYLAHYAVHNPMQGKPELVEKYKAKAASLPPAGPVFAMDHGVSERQIQNHPVYAAMMESLDESVGRVLQKLKELKLDDKTIVIFTADNGGLSTSEGRPTSNLPLSTGKGWSYEGGVREPLIIKWPGVTPAGSVSAEPVTSPDFYPTLLQMIGRPVPAGQNVDGESIVPLLKGGTLPERPLFWHYPHYSNQGGDPSGAVRLGDYKLVENYLDMSVELFCIKDDIGEKHDLSKTYPEKADEMTRMLHAWRARVGAVMPTPNPGYNSNKGAVSKKGKKGASKAE
jgi:arylsulfatase A-like enzyme